MTGSTDLTTAWESAYGRRENFVFQPSSELVRFVSRNFRRRTGLDEFVDVIPGIGSQPILDACCGIGRNLVFGTQMGLEMHGFDLSARAVSVAREWLGRAGVVDAEARVVAASVDSLPFADARFAHAMCEDALDSMPFVVARAGIAEIARVLRPGGLFYTSLIASEESGFGSDYAEEVIVESDHERDTVQSFFDRKKLDALLLPHFELVSIHHMITRFFDPERIDARWVFIGRRR